MKPAPPVTSTRASEKSFGFMFAEKFVGNNASWFGSPFGVQPLTLFNPLLCCQFCVRHKNFHSIVYVINPLGGIFLRENIKTMPAI